MRTLIWRRCLKCLTFAFEQFIVFRLTPRFLLEPRTTSFAIMTAGVVLTTAYEFVRVRGIGYVTEIRVTVTTTSTANTYVFYRIKVLKKQTKKKPRAKRTTNI